MLHCRPFAVLQEHTQSAVEACGRKSSDCLADQIGDEGVSYFLKCVSVRVLSLSRQMYLPKEMFMVTLKRCHWLMTHCTCFNKSTYTQCCDLHIEETSVKSLHKILWLPVCAFKKKIFIKKNYLYTIKVLFEFSLSVKLVGRLTAAAVAH